MVYLSPGVYVKEKDISNIVPNIATTTCGLVGYSAQGNVDDIVLITTGQQFVKEYGTPVPGNYFHYTALAFLEKGNKLYCQRVHNGAKYGGVKIMQDGSGPNLALTVGSTTKTFHTVSGEDILFYVYGKDPGVWNDTVGIVIENVIGADYTFDIVVYVEDADGNDVETERWTVSRKQQLDGNGRQQYLEDSINGFSDYIAVADNTSIADTVLPEVQSTVLNLGGGDDGSAVADSHVIAGWDKFANPDFIDIRLMLNGGYTSVAVQNKMRTVCESRMDCMAILDMPYSQLTSVSAMVNWRKLTQNFNSNYVALYSPWVKIYDTFNDKIIDVPPSGYVGAQFAYNDFVAEVFYAPAGLNRGLLNVQGFSNTPFTQGERDTLYQNQINPLQSFPGEGNVIWGQKTEQAKASALDRVNVRRLLITIEKSCAAALRYFCFEPNNQLTRFRVVAMIEEFLSLLGSKGAFQTELGDKGYRVLCDETNNTPATIDRNELHVDIFVKPIRAAEFIQLQTIITTTGSSFNELIARGVQF